MNILSSLLIFILEKIGALPEIYVSTETPSAADGKNGDIWVVYQ